MPQMGMRTTKLPPINTLSLREQNISPGVQGNRFDAELELDHSPVFSDADETSMDFEW
jgi:hypothetical protein